ncbi:MAG: glycosyltransferase family 10 [Myxococcota bacterium]
MVLRIKFTDFWRGFDPHKSFVIDAIRDSLDYRLVDHDPDFLVYSVFGARHRAHPDAVKIFYSGENRAPHFGECDYALGCDFIDFGDRYCRLPLSLTWIRLGELHDRPVITPDDLEQKRRFCNFIYSNANVDPIRDRFFRLLNARRHVDSAGRHLTNTDALDAGPDPSGGASRKLRYQAQFRFTIAFENSSYPGYTTEKLYHAFAARTVPIYWGNPRVARDFSAAAFLNAHECSGLEELADRVIALDDDPAALLRMLNEAPIATDAVDHRKRAQDFLHSIFGQEPRAARRRPTHGWSREHEHRVARRHRGMLGRVVRKIGPIS